MPSLKHCLYYGLFQYPRVLKYRFLSTCRNVTGTPARVQPALLCGGGRICFGRDVQLGCNPAPNLYSGYIFIAALETGAAVEIGDNVTLNNNAVIFSQRAGISIGAGTIAGTNLEVYDSDFHGLESRQRAGEHAQSRPVAIGQNVFIGSNVRILKGVAIGEGSVIGNSAVVTKSFPADSVIAGNPARLIRTL